MVAVSFTESSLMFLLLHGRSSSAIVTSYHSARAGVTSCYNFYLNCFRPLLLCCTSLQHFICKLRKQKPSV